MKKFEVCETCKGTGEITYDMPSLSETRKCPDCEGEGLVLKKST